jgi:hypothetical protein
MENNWEIITKVIKDPSLTLMESISELSPEMLRDLIDAIEDHVRFIEGEE